LNSLVSFSSSFTGYAWGIAFGAAFLETVLGIGLFFPGSTLLLLMGVMAGRGVFDLQTLLLFGFLGALAGDNVNYYLGRRYGVALLQHPRLRFSPELLKKTEGFLNSYGSMSVSFARFVPALKESMPFVAGSVRMRFGRFLFWDSLGAAGWSLEFIGIGYLFSTSLKLAQLWLTRTGYVILIILVVLLALYLLTRFIYARRQRIIALFRSLAGSFMRIPLVNRWVIGHPKSVAFIKSRRFSRSAFSGLTLTLLTVAFLYTGALFAGSVEDFLSRDPIVYVDQIIANAMPRFRTTELTSFFTAVTLLGKSEIVALFFAVSLFLLWYHRRRVYAFRAASFLPTWASWRSSARGPTRRSTSKRPRRSRAGTPSSPSPFTASPRFCCCISPKASASGSTSFSASSCLPGSSGSAGSTWASTISATSTAATCWERSGSSSGSR